MEPRFTLSVQTVLRSTSGAAGFSLEMPIVAAPRHTIPIADQMICRRRFCRLNSGRAISTDEDYATRWPESTPCYAIEGLGVRSEEHTSELQSRFDLVCR